MRFEERSDLFDIPALKSEKVVIIVVQRNMSDFMDHSYICFLNKPTVDIRLHFAGWSYLFWME